MYRKTALTEVERMDAKIKRDARMLDIMFWVLVSFGAIVLLFSIAMFKDALSYKPL
jgi:hypothetical protein